MAALEIIKKLDSDNFTKLKGKCVDFHPILSYMIFSDITGCVSIYNYNTKTRIKHFKIHDDICRCVKFHHKLPIFVSGSDDSKIVLFDYERSMEICRFTNHTEYIRSVDFHRTHPWILSASDDMTIRIWDWQSYKELAIITGHTDYVMCARFHPIHEDLIFSCSLDATVRVWSIAPLIKKVTSVSGINSVGPSSATNMLSVDLFSPSNFEYLHSLTHERGVNWLTIIDNHVYSVDDDNHVKIWSFKYSNGRFSASYHTKLVHHEKSITCVASLNSQYHDMIVSCSEDGQIILWDVERKSLVKSFQLNMGNLWSVCCHPTSNIIGVAHDQGFLIFKLYRERPTFSLNLRPNTNDQIIYYIKNRSLFKYSTISQKSSFIGKFRVKTKDIIGMNRLSHNPSKKLAMLSPHPKSSNDIIYTLMLESESDTVKSSPKTDPSLVMLARTLSLLFNANFEFESTSNTKKQSGSVDSTSIQLKQTCDAFCGLYLTNSNYVILSRKKSTLYYISDKKESSISLPKATNIFHLYDNTIAVWQESDLSMYLIHFCFDSNQYKVSETLILKSTVKNVSSSFDHTLMCIQLKKKLIIVDASMKKVVKHKTDFNIKGFAWVNYHKFKFIVYNDNRIIRYLLLNGESGILASLSEISYIACASLIKKKKNDKNPHQVEVFTLNKESEIIKYDCDVTEIFFRQCLALHDYDNVVECITSGRLIGQSIVKYVDDCGHPDVALQFSDISQDPLGCLHMALRAFALHKAFQCCEILDEDHYWILLFNASLSVFDLEMCHEIFLRCWPLMPRMMIVYLMAGNREKLLQIYTMCKSKKSFSYQLHCAIMLNDKKLICESLITNKLNNLCALFPLETSRNDQSEDHKLSDDFLEPIDISFSDFNFVAKPKNSELLDKICQATNTTSTTIDTNIKHNIISNIESNPKIDQNLIECLDVLLKYLLSSLEKEDALSQLISITNKHFSFDSIIMQELLNEIKIFQEDQVDASSVVLNNKSSSHDILSFISTFNKYLERKVDEDFEAKKLIECHRHARLLLISFATFSPMNRANDNISDLLLNKSFKMITKYMKVAYLGSLCNSKSLNDKSKSKICYIHCIMALFELKQHHYLIALRTARNKCFKIGCYSLSMYFAQRLSNFITDKRSRVENYKMISDSQSAAEDKTSIAITLPIKDYLIDFSSVRLVQDVKAIHHISCKFCGSEYVVNSIKEENSLQNHVTHITKCKVCLCSMKSQK